MSALLESGHLSGEVLRGGTRQHRPCVVAQLLESPGRPQGAGEVTLVAPSQKTGGADRSEGWTGKASRSMERSKTASWART